MPGTTGEVRVPSPAALTRSAGRRARPRRVLAVLVDQRAGGALVALENSNRHYFIRMLSNMPRISLSVLLSQ